MFSPIKCNYWFHWGLGLPFSYFILVSFLLSSFYFFFLAFLELFEFFFRIRKNVSIGFLDCIDINILVVIFVLWISRGFLLGEELTQNEKFKFKISPLISGYSSGLKFLQNIYQAKDLYTRFIKNSYNSIIKRQLSW